jgi:hypothetical protein
MTEDQKKICIGLGNVSYLPACFDKRFGNNLASIAQTEPEKELSEKQIEWMFRLLYKYRRQLPRTYEKHKGNPLCSRKSPRKQVA